MSKSKFQTAVDRELHNNIENAIIAVRGLKLYYEELLGHEMNVNDLSSRLADIHPYCQAAVCLDKMLETLASLPPFIDNTEAQVALIEKVKQETIACFEKVKQMVIMQGHGAGYMTAA